MRTLTNLTLGSRAHSSGPARSWGLERFVEDFLLVRHVTRKVQDELEAIRHVNNVFIASDEEVVRRKVN
jgi:hypothetical protein